MLERVVKPSANAARADAHHDYRDPSRLFDWGAYGEALRKLAAEHPAVTLRIEPGRALTAYCGWCLTSVVDVKRVGGQWFAVVLGGTHHLRTPAAKNHPQPFAVHPGPSHYQHVIEASPVTMVGQLCTPKDVLARAVHVDRLAVGDIIGFQMVGAYAWNISHRDFLMHEPPSFVAGDPAAGGGMIVRMARAKRRVRVVSA